MKTKLILLFILLIPVTTVNGQEKKWEFGVNAAIGLGGCGRFYDGYHYSNNEFGTLKAGLEATYHLNDRWSLRGGIDVVYAKDDDDDDYWRHYEKRMNNEIECCFTFIHVPVVLQYTIARWRENRHKLVLGIGPSFNFTVGQDDYDFDSRFTPPLEEHPNSFYAKRASVLDGQPKIKTFNIGIQPSFAYHYRHCRFSLEANIGLLDMNKKYAVKTGHRYIYHVWPTFSYYF